MGAVLVEDGDEQARIQRPKQQPTGQHQLSTQQWSDVSREMKMSLREQQVCKLLFDGLTRQKIAEQIGTNRVGVVLRIIQLRDLLSSSPLISTPVTPSPHEETMAKLNRAQPPEG